MKKKLRTSDERAFDATLKSAIMRLGTNPATAATPIPFPYVLYWDRLGRKGQPCKIIRQTTRTAQVEFQDGVKTVLNRQAIRRR